MRLITDFVVFAVWVRPLSTAFVYAGNDDYRKENKDNADNGYDFVHGFFLLFLFIPILLSELTRDVKSFFSPKVILQ